MDLTSQIVEAINTWLQTVSGQLLAPAFTAVGQLLFTTPAFDQIHEVEQLWTIVRNTADALFVLAVIAVGILVMASGTFDSRYAAKLLLPRLLLAAVFVNASLGITGGLIRLNNAIVAGLLGSEPAASATDQFAAILVGHPANVVVGVVVGLASAALALLLLALCIGRDLVLLIATVLSPLALAAYALPQTEELARMWWRIYAALLFVQVVQALLVELGLELLRHTDWLGGPVSDLTSGVLLVTLLYLLFRLPFAAYEWAFRQPLGQSAPVRTALIVARAMVPGA
jgi:hypothetical protein